MKKWEGMEREMPKTRGERTSELKCLERLVDFKRLSERSGSFGADFGTVIWS